MCQVGMEPKRPNGFESPRHQLCIIHILLGGDVAVSLMFILGCQRQLSVIHRVVGGFVMFDGGSPKSPMFDIMIDLIVTSVLRGTLLSLWRQLSLQPATVRTGGGSAEWMLRGLNPKKVNWSKDAWITVELCYSVPRLTVRLTTVTRQNWQDWNLAAVCTWLGRDCWFWKAPKRSSHSPLACSSSGSGNLNACDQIEGTPATNLWPRTVGHIQSMFEAPDGRGVGLGNLPWEYPQMDGVEWKKMVFNGV